MQAALTGILFYDCMELKDSPFVTMVDGVLSKFFGSVIQELSETINFTIEVIGARAAYGNWNEDEQVWTGVIGEVVSNRVDFGVAEFSMTNHRLDVVDFTLPLILSRNKVYFKKHDASSVQWSAYFKVPISIRTLSRFIHNSRQSLGFPVARRSTWIFGRR